MRAFGLSVVSLLCLSGSAVVFSQTIAMSSGALVTGSPLLVSIPVTPEAADRNVHLDISVHSDSGQPATALTESDVTLLDNNHPQAFSSFKEIGAGQEPAELIFVMDAANVRHTNLVYQQIELQDFLRKVGKLPHPATIAVLTDKGVEILPGFSSDGAQLGKSLDNYNASLRTITRDAGFWGATERLDLSLKAMAQLTEYAKTLPGRKFVFWISPGWPLLSGPGIDLDTTQKNSLFTRIVAFSDGLRASRVTVYDVNPFGLQEPLSQAVYYKNFVKGVRKAKETDWADLSLQVLAVQSGGRTVTTSNDISQALKECVAETDSWYEAVFPMAPAEGPNEYHHLEVRVQGRQAALTAHTRDGYYAQPPAEDKVLR